jgi:hypothetical protein
MPVGVMEKYIATRRIVRSLNKTQEVGDASCARRRLLQAKAIRKSCGPGPKPHADDRDDALIDGIAR